MVVIIKIKMSVTEDLGAYEHMLALERLENLK